MGSRFFARATLAAFVSALSLLPCARSADAENRGSPADSQAQRDHRGCCKTGCFPEHTRSVPDVMPQVHAGLVLLQDHTLGGPAKVA